MIDAARIKSQGGGRRKGTREERVEMIGFGFGFGFGLGSIREPRRLLLEPVLG